MKTLRRFVPFALALAFVCLAAPPLTAAGEIVLKASGAQTGPSTGSLAEIGNYRYITVLVNVTAGSGTVTTFRVWLEGSIDNGANWYELPCYQMVKAGAAAPGASAAQRDIVNETSVQTAAKYVANCETYFSQVRAAWNIAGTTPSETFAVSAAVK
jgi:hypothetical protein